MSALKEPDKMMLFRELLLGQITRTELDDLLGLHPGVWAIPGLSGWRKNGTIAIENEPDFRDWLSRAKPDLVEMFDAAYVARKLSDPVFDADDPDGVLIK